MRCLLQVPAQLLLALDRLEQSLEVTVAEAARAVALDHLEEDRRTVAGRLREDLQQVALVVAVHEDAQAAQILHVLVDLADALGWLLVVGVRRTQELDPARLQRLALLADGARRAGDVPPAGPAVELEVLVDLRLALALGR